MATWIKVRAISRSQQIRIKKTKVTTTKSVAINLDDGETRRDLSHHMAIGAVVTVGGATDSAGIAVTNGGLVDQGVSATDLALRVSAGTLRKEDGTTQAINAGTPSVSAADGSNPRIDNVVANATTGNTSVVSGTAAANPVAPTVGSGTVKLAEVYVGAGVTAITDANITDNTRARYDVA